MKKLIAAMCFFASMTAHAGAEFQTTMTAYEGKGFPYPTVGLSLDQHLFGAFGVSGWTGFGSRPNDDGSTKYWSSMKLAFDYQQNPQATWSVGGQISKGKLSDIFTDGSERQVFVKFSAKIW